MAQIEIHKTKNKEEYYAVYKGKNRETLAHSEPETTKQSVKKNIRAMKAIFIENSGNTAVPVKDFTLKEPKTIFI